MFWSFTTTKQPCLIKPCFTKLCELELWEKSIVSCSKWEIGLDKVSSPLLACSQCFSPYFLQAHRTLTGNPHPLSAQFTSGFSCWMWISAAGTDEGTAPLYCTSKNAEIQTALPPTPPHPTPTNAHPLGSPLPCGHLAITPPPILCLSPASSSFSVVHLYSRAEDTFSLTFCVVMIAVGFCVCLFWIFQHLICLHLLYDTTDILYVLGGVMYRQQCHCNGTLLLRFDHSFTQ